MPFNPSTCGEKCSDRSQAGPKKHAVAQDLIIGYSIGSLSSRGSIALVFFSAKLSSVGGRTAGGLIEPPIPPLLTSAAVKMPLPAVETWQLLLHECTKVF